ncbi:hypothetical protein NIES4075_19540 [Tolypothrix sp. NIES-4075]|nr:hypothetical protein NIES4075_19540 [Tolypothrix sp. NIES-4075]
MGDRGLLFLNNVKYLTLKLTTVKLAGIIY